MKLKKIIDYLFHKHSLNCIIKLNPTLLGKEKVRNLLNEMMGYKDINVPDEAFENDTTWEQAQGFVERRDVPLRNSAACIGNQSGSTIP